MKKYIEENIKCITKKVSLSFLLLTILAVTVTVTVDAQRTFRDKLFIDKYQSEERIDGYIRCLTTQIEKERLGSRYDRINKTFEKYLAEEKEQLNSINLRVVYTIPVIFHIIHNGTDVGVGSNISAFYVNEQLAQLNNDFRKIIGTSGQGDGVDTEIQFCAALVDEDGNILPEPGINRIDGISIIGVGSEPYSVSDFENLIKPTTQWNPTKYFNMWVGSLEGGLLGYAQFPEAPTLPGIGTDNGEANTDGVVVTYTSVGSSENPFPGGAPFDEGRTLTHEVGHWLGLRHIWGDGGCNIDDFCEDTPLASNSTSGCPEGKDSCPNDPGLDQIENYMDYSHDACMNIFTQDQTERMRIVMGETGMGSPRREVLLNSTVCIASGFSIALESAVDEVCKPLNGVFDIDVSFIGDFSSSVVLSTAGLPVTTSSVFSQNPVTQSGSYTLTIMGVGSLLPGSYDFTIEGVSGNDVISKNATLIVAESVASVPALILPSNNATEVEQPTFFSWSMVTGASSYDIEISMSTDFSQPFIVQNVAGTTYQTSLLNSTTFYWRVKSKNSCGEGDWSVVYKFTTAASSPCLEYQDIQMMGSVDCLPICQTPSSLDIDFQVWANEAYVIEGLTEGAEYQFNICNGYDPNNWVASLTVLGWDGNNSAQVVTSINGCSITFIAPPEEAVIVVISDICGEDLLAVNNGIPQISCTGGGSILPNCFECDNPIGFELFDSELPKDWEFSVTGTDATWEFDTDLMSDLFENPGTGGWTYYDDDETGTTNEPNIAKATSPEVNLLDYENIFLEFKYSHQDYLGSGNLTLSVTDRIKTYYWTGSGWSTTAVVWLDNTDEVGNFSQSIPTDLDKRTLSVSFVFDDETNWGWGFGFDDFGFCGNELIPCPDENVLALTGQATQGEFFAKNRITSTQEVSGNVTYLAGNSIILKTGFTATSSFRAALQQCIETSSEEAITESRSVVDNKVSIYPNPFTVSTTIAFHLADNQPVKIYVINSLGEVVESIYAETELIKGNHQAVFEASDLFPGLYYVILHTENEILIEKIVKYTN